MGDLMRQWRDEFYNSGKRVVRYFPARGGGIVRLEYDHDTGKDKTFIFKVTDQEVCDLLNTMETSFRLVPVPSTVPL